MPRPRLLAALAILLASLTTAAAPARAGSVSQPGKVFVQCVTMQGNGYNWAATLGWLSGQAEIAAVRAAAWEAAHPGQRAGIDLRCATGSSSGAPSAAILDALLANPALVPGTAPWMSPAEARAVSEALMFMALSTNFDGEFRRLALAGAGSWLGFLGRDGNALQGRYWRGVSTAGVNIEIFGKWIRGARAYRPEWFAESVREDLPLYPERPLMLGQTEADPAAQVMRRIADAARATLNDALADTPALDADIGAGICATVLFTRAEPAPPFDYADLRLAALCNPETSEALATNPQFGRWLAGSDQMRTRLVLGAEIPWRDLLNATLREPELMTPLSGRLLAEPIGLASIAVPAGNASEVATGPVVVLGGFADPRLQAWISAALLSDRLAELRAAGIAADGRLAIFGRTENRADPEETFAQRTMASYFAQDAAGGAGVLARYYAWQDEVCPVADALMPPARVDFYRMDWNLPGQAAAISRRSQIVAAKGYNLGKIQTPRDRYPDLPARFWRSFLFDPLDTPEYLPDPPAGGMSCLPAPG